MFWTLQTLVCIRVVDTSVLSTPSQFPYTWPRFIGVRCQCAPSVLRPQALAQPYFVPHLHTGPMFKFEDLVTESSLLNSPRYVYGGSPPQPLEYLISTDTLKTPIRLLAVRHARFLTT